MLVIYSVRARRLTTAHALPFLYARFMNDSGLSDSDLKPYLEYIRSLFAESDRGFILLAAERIDDLLTELHAAFVERNAFEPWIDGKPVKAQKWAKSLLNWRGPIGSFAGRIALAYAYGLISTTEYHNLEIIREIRNRAAHPDGPPYTFSFRSSDTLRQVRRLKIIENQPLHVLSEEDRKAMVNFERELDQPGTTTGTTHDPIRIYFATLLEHLSGYLIGKVYALRSAELSDLKERIRSAEARARKSS